MEEMYRKGHYAEYKSPNIVIVPTVCFSDSSTPKKAKLETKCANSSCDIKTSSVEPVNHATVNKEKPKEISKTQVTGKIETSKSQETCASIKACTKPANSECLSKTKVNEKSVKVGTKIETKIVSKSCFIASTTKSHNSDNGGKQDQATSKTKNVNKSCDSKAPYLKMNNLNIQDTFKKQKDSKVENKSLNMSHVPKSSKSRLGSCKINNEKTHETYKKMEKTGSAKKIYVCIPEKPLNCEKSTKYKMESEDTSSSKPVDPKSITFAGKVAPPHKSATSGYKNKKSSDLDKYKKPSTKLGNKETNLSNKIEKVMPVLEQPKSNNLESLNLTKVKEKHETNTSWASNFMQSVGEIRINKKRLNVKTAMQTKMPKTDGNTKCDEKVEKNKVKPSPPKKVNKEDVPSVSKKLTNSKSTIKKYRKIKLEITVMFNSPSENHVNEGDEDIRFLEDINVDEIVKSLDESAPSIEQEITRVDNDKENKEIQPTTDLKTDIKKEVVEDVENNVDHINDNLKKDEDFPVLDNKEIKNNIKSVVKAISNHKHAPTQNSLTESEQVLAKRLEKRIIVYLNINCTIISTIRRGKFSRIFHCKDVNNQEYAVKVLNNAKDRYHLGINKENMLMKLQREIPKDNLTFVYIYNGFSLSSYWCFFMDYYPMNLQEALIERVTPFHIDVVQRLARQLIAAVTMLRNNNIVHSDIKPAHILVNKDINTLKLCGFDSAFYIAFARSMPNIGTVNYRAPELILGYSASYSIDVWSTALVMHEMATGIKLFPGIYNNEILYKQISTLGDIPFDMIQECMYKEHHFVGTCFIRRSGYKGQEYELLHNFTKPDKLRSTLSEAYAAHWSTGTKEQQQKDRNKINLFYNLLKQMLILHPAERLAIEFAYANPFIYEHLSP